LVVINGEARTPGRVGKVCNLCRVLETGISAMLTVKSNLGILFD
jgi:hypothetical protein